MGRLQGKTAVIPSGTKGIGLATATKMVREDASVFACARHLPAVPVEGVHYAEVDVTDPSAYLASDEASYITGAVIDANGGMRL